MNDLNMLKTGKQCAKFSFIVGTVILLLYLITKSDELIMFGCFYLIVACCINALLLILILFLLVSNPKSYREILITIGIIMLNIPIALFYLWVFEHSNLLF